MLINLILTTTGKVMLVTWTMTAMIFLIRVMSIQIPEQQILTMME